MADGPRRGGGRSGEAGPDIAAPEPEDPQDLGRDWITVWQSELAAMAADRELQEGWQALLALWAGAANTLMQAMPRDREPQPASRRAGAAASPGTAATAAASDARDAEIERLSRRVAELERRLGGVERGARADRPPRRGGSRKRPA